MDWQVSASGAGSGAMGSQELTAPTGSSAWADSAYRSEEMEAKLSAMKSTSHIHRKGKRGKPLTEQAKGSNRTKSTVRVWVEHIFGAQANDMGGTLVRTIDLARAKSKIGIRNLAQNMRRLGQLGCQNHCAAWKTHRRTGRSCRATEKTGMKDQVTGRPQRTYRQPTVFLPRSQVSDVINPCGKC